MNFFWMIVACGCLGCAIPPCLLFLRNLAVFPRPRSSSAGLQPSPANANRDARCSVIIPARNEAHQIGELLESLLKQTSPPFEVIVYDDASTDGTGEVVEDFARRNDTVRLIRGQPLAAGWCGKQHACYHAATQAIGDVLLFLDADVRLKPNAIRYALAEMMRQRVDYLSGFPRQLAAGMAEKAVLPLIHFILLCYLPMDGLFGTNSPAFAAGCGQFVVCNRAAYLQCGGHGGIRQSRHDGLKLPRWFRLNGLRTGIFDASTLADCRMYSGWRELWLGLAKNATEGIAAPNLIVPFSLLLIFGQILPLPAAVLAFSFGLGGITTALLAAAAFASYLPRWLGVARFRQSLVGALLHPLGVLFLLSVQWWALWRANRGRSVAWKDRMPNESDVREMGAGDASQPSSGGELERGRDAGKLAEPWMPGNIPDRMSLGS